MHFFSKKDCPPLESELVSWLGSFLSPLDLISFTNGDENYIYSIPNTDGTLGLIKSEVSRTNSREVAVEIYDPSILKKQDHNNEWVTLFESFFLHIREKKVHQEKTCNLRAGLTDSQKQEAIVFVKLVLESLRYQRKGVQPVDIDVKLSDVFFMPATIGVAFWVEGRLRGSSVHSEKTLKDALYKASVASANNAQYKPLSEDEYKKCTIQITLVKDLGMVLKTRDLETNVIDPNKAYHMSASNKSGWLLPEALNMRIFNNLDSFLGTLAKEKLNLSVFEQKKVLVRMFETDDFVIDPTSSVHVNLYGPVPASKRVHGETNKYLNRYDDMFSETARWVCSVQDPKDGSIPAVINPVTDRINTFIQWPRMAMTLYGLSAYSNSHKDGKLYREHISRGLSFLETHLNGPLHYISEQNVGLSFVYLGHTYAELQQMEKAREICRSIYAGQISKTLISTDQNNSIFFLQAASLLARLGFVELDFALKSKTIADQAYDVFIKDDSRDLVSYAELVHVYHLISLCQILNTAERADAESKLQTLFKVYSTHQKADGSFPSTSHNPFVHTRGVGKILEVLSLRFLENESLVLKGLNWLETMQFSEKTDFFLPLRPRIARRGGFRYGYENYELWSDAAGHVLQCAGRIKAQHAD